MKISSKFLVVKVLPQKSLENWILQSGSNLVLVILTFADLNLFAASSRSCAKIDKSKIQIPGIDSLISIIVALVEFKNFGNKIWEGLNGKYFSALIYPNFMIFNLSHINLKC